MTLPEAIALRADVLAVGAGAAGLMAAHAATERGATVIVAEKSLIGRGGATVLAQMTVAAALGEAEPDDPDIHALDTIVAGRSAAGSRE